METVARAVSLCATNTLPFSLLSPGPRDHMAPLVVAGALSLSEDQQHEYNKHKPNRIQKVPVDGHAIEGRRRRATHCCIPDDQ